MSPIDVALSQATGEETPLRPSERAPRSSALPPGEKHVGWTRFTPAKPMPRVGTHIGPRPAAGAASKRPVFVPPPPPKVGLGGLRRTIQGMAAVPSAPSPSSARSPTPARSGAAAPAPPPGASPAHAQSSSAATPDAAAAALPRADTHTGEGRPPTGPIQAPRNARARRREPTLVGIAPPSEPPPPTTGAIPTPATAPEPKTDVTRAAPDLAEPPTREIALPEARAHSHGEPLPDSPTIVASEPLPDEPTRVSGRALGDAPESTDLDDEPTSIGMEPLALADTKVRAAPDPPAPKSVPPPPPRKGPASVPPPPPRGATRSAPPPPPPQPVAVGAPPPPTFGGSPAAPSNVSVAPAAEPPPPPAPTVPGHESLASDVFDVGSPAPAASADLGEPMALVPARRSPRRLAVFLAAFGATALVGGIVVAIVITSKTEPEPEPVATSAPTAVTPEGAGTESGSGTEPGTGTGTSTRTNANTHDPTGTGTGTNTNDRTGTGTHAGTGTAAATDGIDLPTVPERVQRMSRSERNVAAQRLLRQARPYERTRRYVPAERTLREALIYSPESPTIAVRMAVLKHRERELDAAEAWARRAIALDSGSAYNHVILGDVLGAKRDISGARAEWTEALRLNPHHRGARRRLDRLHH